MKAYIDSDVLIWHLRGERKALNLLKRLRDKEKFGLWTGAMQRAEVVFFMRPEEEEATLLFLTQFQQFPLKILLIHLLPYMEKSQVFSQYVVVNSEDLY